MHFTSLSATIAVLLLSYSPHASATMEWSVVSGTKAASTAPSSTISTDGGTTSAQFSYTKTSDPLPLVGVYLRNAQSGSDLLLQSNFDIVGQACSCYFLDAGALATTYSDAQLPSSLQYRIVFKGQSFETGSGWLGIVRGANTTGLVEATGPLTNPGTSGAGNGTTSSGTPTIDPKNIMVVTPQVIDTPSNTPESATSSATSILFQMSALSALWFVALLV